MRIIFITLLCFIFTHSIFSQKENLLNFNKERLTLTKQSMLVLGGWSVANMGISGVQMTRTEGQTFHFHQMNVAWSSVNLAIAGLGYWNSRKSVASDFDLSSTIKAQSGIQNALLFNSGLDFAYMAGGIYLLERAKTDLENGDRWNGFGQSLILQGGFLLVFDLIQFGVHARHGKELFEILDGLEVNVGNGIGLKYTW